MEQELHLKLVKNALRPFFEGEVSHSNIGPAVFDITLKKLPDFIGDAEQYLFEAKDMTARKLTERRLVESES